MIVLLEQRQISTKLMGYSFPVVPYVNTGQYVTYAFNMSGGCIIKWFRDNLAQDIKASEDAYQLLNKEAPECPTNLIMLPYLVGAGTPTMDAVTPGVVAGLRYSTGRGELFRAFLEGESYEMKLNLECLKKAGIDAARIITVGGGSGSDLWMQLRADIFEKTVETTKNKEAGTLGSAILCYVNSGCYSTLQEAQTDLVRTQERFEPNMCHSKIYRKQYQRYIKLYDCMKEIYV
jgi:xylulokinase